MAHSLLADIKRASASTPRFVSAICGCRSAKLAASVSGVGNGAADRALADYRSAEFRAEGGELK
jgi:hypothetical protein